MARDGHRRNEQEAKSSLQHQPGGQDAKVNRRYRQLDSWNHRAVTA